MRVARGCVGCTRVLLGVAVALLGFAVAVPQAAWSQTATSGTTPLDQYLKGLTTLRLDFAQTLTDSRGKIVQKANGVLTVVRPGRFRWELTPVGGAGPQLMVADGKNLWFYDRDLEQVSVRPAGAALTATPAALLSSTSDLRTVFRIAGSGRRDGFDWVVVTPLRADADFREARLGFSRGELKRMVLKDKLGQTATLAFDRAARNAAVAPSEVSFTPPPGADLIGKPTT
jgi:outer membrane lipoprotein carrier protein